MSAARRGGRRGGAHADAHADERWLLTYSDMITLLMALFIVMWAISSVNVSKFDQLKASLRSAFSGKVVQAQDSVLTGQAAVLAQPGAPVSLARADTLAGASALAPKISQQLASAAAKHELDNLRRVQRQIEQFARTHGFSGQLRTSIDERGLVIQLLTDEVLFDTGHADLKAQSMPLLGEISKLISRRGLLNPVRVEGNTDSQPVTGGPFRSNWELSTARADAVLEFLLGHGVAPHRLSVAGYADQKPIAPNATASGRALNRRVNLVVLRRYGQTQGS